MTARGGQILRSDIVYPKGDPENALTWDEMKEKFHLLAGPVVSPSSQRQIIDAIESLEEMTDLRELGALLAAG